MNKIIGVIFAMFCIATAMLSNSMMGAGFWFWVIVITGLFVGISQFTKVLKGMGTLLAMLLSIISIFAVLLGLVAATAGGFFNMDDQSALLLTSFFMIAVSGFSLAITYIRAVKRNNSGIEA